jgi:hypothetical protein
MADKIREFGMHSRDIVELLRNVDRAWLLEHPEQEDPGEYFRISKKKDGTFSMYSDRRQGFAIQKADTATEVVSQLVERGFDTASVEAELRAVEVLWNKDMLANRNELASIDVKRRGNGYVWRAFGANWIGGRPMSADALKKALYFHDQNKLDELIARADREWDMDEPAT